MPCPRGALVLGSFAVYNRVVAVDPAGTTNNSTMRMHACDAKCAV
jgi:hypothetical protein